MRVAGLIGGMDQCDLRCAQTKSPNMARTIQSSPRSDSWVATSLYTLTAAARYSAAKTEDLR
eukprot:1887163-Pyramimonas_sp.AAC.1